MDFREEQDSMGVVRVPMEAYYGAQTERARQNFAISGQRLPMDFIRALGLIKKQAAMVNRDLGLLPAGLAVPIITAASEVADGKHFEHFVVDVFQTGSGTSTNMNANEVIAGRANEILTGRRGGKEPVHPNDPVNMGQSSNDVIPSAIHIAGVCGVTNLLLPAVADLQETLSAKARDFAGVRKIGRTHLQDAVPMTLGQEFSGYARQMALGHERLQRALVSLLELALGGTAVGTGLNTASGFATLVIAGLAEESGCPFKEAKNHFEAQAGQDAAVEMSGALKTLAVSLSKIANDIRWLGSGPRCGIGELVLPSLQPGSSIMPGKVNPVIPEAVLQVAAQVIGNDSTITVAGQSGVFELNVMLPVIAHNLLQSIHLLVSAVTAFDKKCLRDLKAEKAQCAANLEQSLALAAVFVPIIGYDKAAGLAKEAYSHKTTIREAAIRQQILPLEEINRIIDEMIGERGRDL